jgi:hypothetical protein
VVRSRVRIVQVSGWLAALAAALALVWAVGAAGAGAGGWAMTSVEDMPAALEPGEPVDVELTVLQHGQTPVSGESVTVVVGPVDGRMLRFPATPTGQPGHYRAQILVDSGGSWPWYVEQGIFGPQDLGRLDVGDVGGGSGSDPGSGSLTAPLPARVALTAAAGLAVLVAVAMWRRSRDRQAPAPA